MQPTADEEPGALTADEAAERIAELGRVYAEGFITLDELTASVIKVLQRRETRSSATAGSNPQ
jgi:hypothetical protein